MTRAKRQRLEARAYPDPFTLAGWRVRAWTLGLSAFALGVVHLYFYGLIVAGFAWPYVQRIVRRELAVGALIAAAHRRRARRLRTPTVDLRDVYRRL
jgi:hypothetical protein